MKFQITIQDLDAESASEILAKLSGQPAAVGVQELAPPAQSLRGGNESEFDSAGQPWDERIHASTKSKNADGKWKKRKGAGEAETMSEKLDRIEAIIPAQTPSFAPVATTVAAPVVAPVAPPVAAPVAAPVVPAATITRDFKGLMLRISNLFATKQVEPNYPQTIVQRINQGYSTNVSTITDIAANADYVEYAWKCLEVDGKAA